MREINRVKDALEWCDKAIEMIEQDPGSESLSSVTLMQQSRSYRASSQESLKIKSK